MRLDFTYVRNEENLPGSLTSPEFKSNPRQRNPAAAFADEARNYDYLRGAFTVRTLLSDVRALEWALQYNYQDLDHPLSFAIIDDVTNNWGAEMRYLDWTPFFGRNARFTIGAQYFGTRQSDLNFANVQGDCGAKTKDQLKTATNVGIYWVVAAMVRCNSGHSNLSSSEVPSGERYRGEVPPAEVGFTEVCPTEIRPPELCPAEMHPLKFAHRRRAPLRFTQGRCTMRRSAAVRSHLTPEVASRHRCHANTPCLTEYCALCVVRHGANLVSGP
jgi:hypothetical protein